MTNVIDTLAAATKRDDLPEFRAGDTLKVDVKVVEGNRSRVQVFQGVCIHVQGSGVGRTFSVRKVSFGVGVERTFPLHTPIIDKIEVVTRGDVRRAKLYYLRGRVGKRARVAERRWGIQDDLVIADEAEAEAIDSEGVAQSEAEDVPPPEPSEDEEGAAEEGAEDAAKEPAETPEEPESDDEPAAEGEPAEGEDSEPSEGEAAEEPGESSSEDSQKA